LATGRRRTAPDPKSAPAQVLGMGGNHGAQRLMKIRDRIKELRRVKASELLPNPKNWRTHPQHQRDALKGVLAEVGYADALLARETPDGLQLIDGHLRAETTPDQEVPVLVLDVDEREADYLLATHDPLAALAEANTEALRSLAESTRIEGGPLGEMIAAIVGPLDAGDLLTEEGASGAKNIVATITIPPRVWLTMRSDLVPAVEQACAPYGLGVEWPD
jgi:hypothetical protein